jgi:hypothetical protein
MWAVIAGALIVGIASSGSVDVRNDPIRRSPGLYFLHEAQARLYTSEWRIVTYINLQQASDNVNAIGKYIESTERFCGEYNRLTGLNLTECMTPVKN